MTEQEPTPLVCVNHPNRTTYLRCNRCGDPICPECAVLTPTGYRCRKCVNSQQKVYNTAHWMDYPLAVVIAGALGFGGSLIAARLGFFTLFVAPIAGIIIAEAVRWATGRRRSKRLFQIATAAAVVGSLPLLLINLLGMLVFGQASLMSLLPLAWQGLYAFLVASSVYYRLSGIRMGR